MLATACSGLASNLNLAHPCLAGACNLMASLVAARESGFKAVAASLLEGVRQLLLDTANMECGVRLGLIDRDTDTVVVLSRPDACRRSSTGVHHGRPASGFVLAAPRQPALAESAPYADPAGLQTPLSLIHT